MKIRDIDQVREVHFLTNGRGGFLGTAIVELMPGQSQQLFLENKVGLAFQPYDPPEERSLFVKNIPFAATA
jgi:hypothetical protein